MTYRYNTGVIVPFVQKHFKMLIVAVTALFVSSVLAMTISASAATTVVYEDTSTGENQPGWLFNRDPRTATPYSFVNSNPSIGSGSLYVEPIANDFTDSCNSTPAPPAQPNCDKFIAEFYDDTLISELNSFSYDFEIGTGGVEADKVHFYLNVYANFAESDNNKFYDCRYNIVPSVGAVGNYETVTFDPTQSYPVTTRTGVSASPHACPSVPADMDNHGAGSNIRVFAINLGDTSGNDQDLDGYFDNVVYDTDNGSTTFDFDPLPRMAAITAPGANEVVSGSVELAAYLQDDDADSVQWAMRADTCAASTGTVFGNVDGKTDVATLDQTDLSNQKFSFFADTTTVEDGEYCFVYNPVEDAGETNIRLTREFVVDNRPDTKDECKNGGWMMGLDLDTSFRNQGDCVSYFATGGANPATNGATNERANRNR